ncbi:ABC transporter substrate-binding protein [uncultured Bartonella sp.]|uniref:ABC transporter substrate-binding protein n=1 Tax=uncultured Bartonella sp. TaxID=104108 RepID=UPI002639F6CB|nr:ABC transporter substrate-binding protein [uncultured Bartonella sp.]
MNFLYRLGLVVAVIFGTLTGHVFASDEAEKKDITLSVGGAPLFYYLPLTIAEKKGFFKEEGLNVKIVDLKGGSQSLQALLGGSADVTTGAYDQVIRMHSKGQDVRAVLELDRYPAIVLAVRADLNDKVKKVGDLKGMKIGVTAPGSSTNNFLNYLLAQNGLKPDEVSVIGTGAGATAIAAMKRGEIDAIVNLDPVISTLMHDHLIFILVDTRTEADMEKVFGVSTMSSGVLYTKKEFIDNNPNTVQHLTNAFEKALKWLQTATPEDVANTVPPEYIGNNREVYLDAVKHSLPTYSHDGMITRESQEATLKLLSYDKTITDAKIDLSQTFDDRFVKKALAQH